MKRTWLAYLLELLVVLAMPAVALADDGSADGHFVFGGNYVLRAGESLRGDLVILGGNARLEAGSTVNGNIVTMGGSVDVAGQVSGDVTILGGSVDLKATAVVSGQVMSIGGSVQRDPGAQVQGDVVEGDQVVPWSWHGPMMTRNTDNWMPDALGWILGSILAVLGIMALALLATLLLPTQTEQVVRVISDEPVLSLAAGLLTIIILPILLVILVITCIGPVLLGLAFAVAMLFGWIAVGLTLGRAILKAFKVQEVNALVAVLIGVVILTLLSRVPCIGWLLGLLAASLGLGAVILTRFGTSTYPWPRMDQVSATAAGGLPTAVDYTPPSVARAVPEAQEAAEASLPDQDKSGEDDEPAAPAE